MGIRKKLRRLFAKVKLPQRKPDHTLHPLKIPRIEAAAFWRNYDATPHPTRAEEKRIFGRDKLLPRYPVRVTPSVLGVVRQFSTAAALRVFEENVEHINSVLTRRRFVHFVYQPMQLFFADHARHRIVERVYPGLNAEQALELSDSGNADNHHKKKFLEKMRRRGVVMLEFDHAVQRAYDELLPFHPKVITDKHITNVIVLDYNPKTKRCLLTLVDQELSRKR